jgi:MFS family permease
MTLGYKREAVLGVLLVCAVIGVYSMVKFGALSDRIGRKKVFLWGTAALMVFILPYLWMLNQKSLPFLAVALFIGFAIIWPTYGSLIGTLIAESFSPDIRYTGASLGYQLGAAIAGGPAPLIATALLAAFGGSYLPVGLFIVLCGAISLAAVAFAKEKSNQEID